MRVGVWPNTSSTLGPSGTGGIEEQAQPRRGGIAVERAGPGTEQGALGLHVEAPDARADLLGAQAP